MNTSREDSLNAFSSRLCQALNEAGYKINEQSKLGNLFGVSGQAVRKWIQSESMPSSSRVNLIADILDVRSSWLMYGEEPMRDGLKAIVSEPDQHYSIEISQREQRMIQNLRELPKSTRDAIDALIISLKETD